MVVNPDLIYLLDQTCKVFRPTEATTNMVTAQALALNASAVPTHIQAKSVTERALGSGYEQAGDYWGFYHSTGDVAVGDLVQGQTGPHAGKNFWLRGFTTDTNIEGVEHLMAELELTTVSTGATV
jgi:hypothetical protein